MSAEPAALGLRERKKLKTRQTIRSEAMRLFQEQGYAETSVEQIAEASEVSPSTFFRYFPTKEQVVLVDDVDPIMIAAVARQPLDLPPLTVLRNVILETMAELSEDEREREAMRQRLLYSVPELRVTMLDEMNRNIDMIANGLAARLGRDGDEFEMRVMAGAVVGGIHAVVSDQRLAEFGRDHVEHQGTLAARAVSFIEQGMPLH